MRCSVVQCRWDGIVYDGGVYDTGSICRAGGVQSSESFSGAGVSSGCDDDGVRVELESSWRGNGGSWDSSLTTRLLHWDARSREREMRKMQETR
jgi:hypothetical protein